MLKIGYTDLPMQEIYSLINDLPSGATIDLFFDTEQNQVLKNVSRAAVKQAKAKNIKVKVQTLFNGTKDYEGLLVLDLHHFPNRLMLDAVITMFKKTEGYVVTEKPPTDLSYLKALIFYEKGDIDLSGIEYLYDWINTVSFDVNANGSTISNYYLDSLPELKFIQLGKGNTFQSGSFDFSPNHKLASVYMENTITPDPTNFKKVIISSSVIDLNCYVKGCKQVEAIDLSRVKGKDGYEPGITLVCPDCNINTISFPTTLWRVAEILNCSNNKITRLNLSRHTHIAAQEAPNDGSNYLAYPKTSQKILRTLHFMEINFSNNPLTRIDIPTDCLFHIDIKNGWDFTNTELNYNFFNTFFNNLGAFHLSFITKDISLKLPATLTVNQKSQFQKKLDSLAENYKKNYKEYYNKDITLNWVIY